MAFHRVDVPQPTNALRIAIIAHLKHPIAEPFCGGLEMHTSLLERRLTAAGHDVTLYAAAGSAGRNVFAVCEPPTLRSKIGTIQFDRLLVTLFWNQKAQSCLSTQRAECTSGLSMLDAISVLLVEDETLLHLIIEEGLTDAGFESVVASDGHSAIAMLDAHCTLFRAVLTDIRLGDGPSGWDVARHARERIPGVPVIYMSADSALNWTSKGVPGSIMIQKPFVIAQIITAIATLLDAV